MLALVCFPHAERDSSRDVVEILVDREDDRGRASLAGESFLMGSGVEGDR